MKQKNNPPAKKTSPIKTSGNLPMFTLVFEKKNYILMIGGVIFVFLGYILMVGGQSKDPSAFSEDIFSFQRITLAPILLLIGFILEIFAILWRPKQKEETASN